MGSGLPPNVEYVKVKIDIKEKSIRVNAENRKSRYLKQK